MSDTPKPLATRQAYGNALLALGAEHPELVVFDADLSGSTNTAKFAKAYPERFFNMGIAEQNMVSTAAGIATTGKVPFVSSFAMFAAGRAWEQVRNSVAHNHLNVKIAATHAGITLGQDGASHQIIEDFALMTSIPGMNVFVPADEHETTFMVEQLLTVHRGPAYLRLCRQAFPPVYESAAALAGRPLTAAQILRRGEQVSLIAVGVMVHLALIAAEQLAAKGISAEVVNLSCLKPLDHETVLTTLRRTGCAVVAEEHNHIGGANQLVAACGARYLEKHTPIEVVAIEDQFGQSGTASELMAHYGLTAEQIVSKAERALRRKK